MYLLHFAFICLRLVALVFSVNLFLAFEFIGYFLEFQINSKSLQLWKCHNLFNCV